jgi:hypothetical protein
MRWRILVAIALVVASLGAVVVAACSGPTCKAGTLQLDIALASTAPLADSITVVGNDPGAAVDETFPHTPNPMAPGIEHTTVTVTFPCGYPADSVLHLVVRAIGGVTVLGVNTVTIHLDEGCSSAGVLVSGGGVAPNDLGTTD